MSNINIEYEDDDYYEKFQKELSPRTNYGEGYYRTEKKLLNLTKTNIKIMSKYIIIDAEAIQKRIEELKFQREREPDNYTQSFLDGKIKQLKQILSQSTPLIPEIEKAFESGVDSLQDNLIQKLGLTYQTNQVSSTTVNSTRGNLENYISNLKLDI